MWRVKIGALDGTKGLTRGGLWISLFQVFVGFDSTSRWTNTQDRPPSKLVGKQDTNFFEVLAYEGSLCQQPEKSCER